MPLGCYLWLGDCVLLGNWLMVVVCC